MSTPLTYKERLRDPRWLQKRELLFESRGEKCQSCGETKELTIHHGYYRFKADPWDYEDESLWILCWPCHERVQENLVRIHEIIGHLHPDDYPEVLDRIYDSTFEFRFGLTKEEVAEILRDERSAEAESYSSYSVSIISSTELGPTTAYDLEDALTSRFPGISTGVSRCGGERDAVAVVSGPDDEIASRIQGWCDKWPS